MAAVMASSMAMQAQVQAPLLQQQLMTQQHSPGPARLRAYTQVMRIFMQGSYDLAKEEALASLRSALAISEQEHLSVKAAAMAETQHHLQLHPQPSQAPAEPQAAHPSQAPAVAARAQAAGTKRLPPPVATKPAAAPRKRTRASEAGAASRGGARAQATGPASPAPRALPGAGVEVDPLVGHVVMRYWPTDGGWFKGVVSDFQPQSGDHCIIYDIGSSTESFEWYNIRGASQQDCIVQEEKVDFASLAPPSAAAAAPRTKKAPAGAAAGATPRSGAAAKQPQSSVGSASKAGASRPAGATKAAGAAKPAAARAAARPAARPSPPAAPQQAPAALPAVAPVQQQQQLPPQQAQQAQQQSRSGKTSSHHHAHRNGLTSHAAAVKQALAAGGRPPYLNGHTLLPRRTRNWSSDEDSSSDDE